uniref:H/ACA ribonucleoprotein complex subunit n=1 Tax=Ascaris suum TaxID=6253 RepID=F1L2L4_ASCSU
MILRQEPSFRMSFRGRGGGRGGRGYSGGRGGGGGRGGFRGGYDQGPPQEVIEVGYFTHTCEDDIVCHTTVGKIPYFNAPIYFENKEQIGKIDEIFGGIKDNGFSVKLSNDIKASSFKEGQKLYIDPAKLLPIERFLPQSGAARGRGRGRGGDRGARGNRGGGRGGGDRGGFKGGRGGGGFRGGDRGNRGFRGSDRSSGGFRGGDRQSGGGFRGGDRRSGGGFRGGGDRGGGYKRPFDSHSSSTPQNKKMKFDD